MKITHFARSGLFLALLSLCCTSVPTAHARNNASRQTQTAKNWTSVLTDLYDVSSLHQDDGDFIYDACFEKTAGKCTVLAKVTLKADNTIRIFENAVSAAAERVNNLHFAQIKQERAANVRFFIGLSDQSLPLLYIRPSVLSHTDLMFANTITFMSNNKPVWEKSFTKNDTNSDVNSYGLIEESTPLYLGDEDIAALRRFAANQNGTIRIDSSEESVLVENIAGDKKRKESDIPFARYSKEDLIDILKIYDKLTTALKPYASDDDS